MTDKIYIFIICVLGILILIFLLTRIKKLFILLNSIANDTLKRIGDDGQLHWSPTKLTMASAWFVVIWSYHYDLVKNGFNETAFMVLTGVALGAKVTDAWSKKMNPLVQPPKEETKTEENV